jgi:hypothetical protein
MDMKHGGTYREQKEAQRKRATTAVQRADGIDEKESSGKGDGTETAAEGNTKEGGE